MLQWGIFFCLPLVLFKYLIKYHTFQNNLTLDRDFVPKSGPAVLSCELLKASCALLKTCAAVGAVKAETAPPSWLVHLSLAPIHVLQSLFPPLAREPEHPATLGELGCRISILFIVKYFYSVGFGFFFLHPLSPLTCLLPQTPISSLLIKAWWALFSFNPKWFYLLASVLTWVFFFTSSSLFTPQYPKPWWTILNSLPPWVGARREEKLRDLLWVWATSFEPEGWQSAEAVDSEGKKGDSSF